MSEKTSAGGKTTYTELTDGTADAVPPGSGLVHTMISLDEQFNPNYKKKPGDKVLQNNGAYIVFGTDGETQGGGKGAAGYRGAASIDLVVGRMANTKYAGEKQAKAKKDEESSWVDSSFAGDAARIYLGQLTDVDKAFSLAYGVTGQDKDRSAIGLKADGIRIIGRTGIRLITGKADGVEPTETTTRGGKIVQPAPCIEFIAGNNTDDEIIWGGLFNPTVTDVKLQPIVLAYKLQSALLELMDILDDQVGMVNNLAMWCMQGFTATSSAIAVIPGMQSAAAQTTTAALRSYIDTAAPNYAITGRQLAYRGNYLTPAVTHWIGSRWVHST
tara:strand:- start:2087 stop:3073 length:987 start_codon:yes stop_codon:yes gene_type:complete